MSSLSLSFQTLRKSCDNRSELALAFQSLPVEQKYRCTRIISAQFTDFVLKRLRELDVISEIPSKPLNSKKTKQKNEAKLSDQAAMDLFFESLMTYSEEHFMDSIGLDFSLMKDADRMINVIAVILAKNPGFTAQNIPPVQEISTKQEISILVAVRIWDQLQQIKKSEKQPYQQPCARKDIGNFWTHLDPAEKTQILLLRVPSPTELVVTLCKKGVIISIQNIEKQIRQLAKLEKNQFCNRVLRCRLKKAICDPIKQYHQRIFLFLIQELGLAKKKKGFKKLYLNSKKQQQKTQIKNQKITSHKVQDKKEDFEVVNLYSSQQFKQNYKDRQELVKEHSVASNQTNETQYREDLKCFGQDILSKRVELLYHHKIASDVIDFGDMIAEKANSFQKYRLVAFNRLQCCLAGYQVQLLLFGSCANGLMVQKSDVDVAIAWNILNYYPYGTIKERVAFALTNLYQMLNQQPWVTKCTLITTAFIPVLKLEIDTSVSIGLPQGMFDNDNIYVGYPNDKIKIDMDVTVDTSPFSGQLPHMGLKATQMTKQWMQQIPNLYNIAILLKYLFQKANFNSTYKGGLGSYCTMVMIIAYLKHYKKQNDELGSQLEGFIDFYAREFDQHMKGVDITGETYFYLKPTPQAKLQVKDPIDNRIMTKNSHLYPKIKEQLLRLKKQCIDNIKNRVLDHFQDLQKQQRENVMKLSQTEYFNKFSELYCKNVFCEFEFP